MRFQSINMTSLHMYRVYLLLYYNCIDSALLIWPNLMWNIRNEANKTFVKTTYIDCLICNMGWSVALFWENYRYFRCSSQNNLMKGGIFLWSVSKIVDLKLLLKLALTGKDIFNISSWSCPCFILRSFCFSFDLFELLILGVLKKFAKLRHFSLLV